MPASHTDKGKAVAVKEESPFRRTCKMCLGKSSLHLTSLGFKQSLTRGQEPFSKLAEKRKDKRELEKKAPTALINESYSQFWEDRLAERAAASRQTAANSISPATLRPGTLITVTYRRSRDSSNHRDDRAAMRHKYENARSHTPRPRQRVPLLVNEGDLQFLDARPDLVTSRLDAQLIANTRANMRLPPRGVPPSALLHNISKHQLRLTGGIATRTPNDEVQKDARRSSLDRQRRGDIGRSVRFAVPRTLAREEETYRKTRTEEWRRELQREVDTVWEWADPRDYPPEAGPAEEWDEYVEEQNNW